MHGDTSGNSSPPAQRSTADGRPIQLEPDTAPVAERIEGELLTAGLHPELAGPLAERISIEVSQSFHQGPLPSVESFAGYDQICPGAARDILNMALNEQRHINFMQKAELLGEIGLKVLGILAAVTVVGMMLGGAVYCVSVGAYTAAAIMGGGGAAATVGGLFLRNFLRASPDTPPSVPAAPAQTSSRGDKQKKKGR